MEFAAVRLAKVKTETEPSVIPTSSQCCGVYNATLHNLENRDQQRQDIRLQHHFLAPTSEPSSSQSDVFREERMSWTKRPTHDFLSLYSETFSQFPETSPSSRGAASSLTTQDLLQPLETSSSPHNLNLAKKVPQRQHLRLAGINRNVQELECKPKISWSDSLLAREENFVVDSNRSSDATVEQEHVETHRCWSNPRVSDGLPDLLYASKSSSNHGPPEANYQQAISRHWQKTSHPYREVIKRPLRDTFQDDEDDVEGLDLAKEHSRVTHVHEVEQGPRNTKNLDGKMSTPRSKHSATEQRRRSKINDRFQMLRSLVPHSDQKRDKASFLLEVIEYVQMLQDKVRSYEGVDQGRHKDRPKSMIWGTCKKSLGQEAFLEDIGLPDAAFFPRNISSSCFSADTKQISEVCKLGKPKLIDPVSDNRATPTDFEMSLHQQTFSYLNGRSAVNGNGLVTKTSSGHDEHTLNMATCSVQPLSAPDIQIFSGRPKERAKSIFNGSAYFVNKPLSMANANEDSKVLPNAKHQMHFAENENLSKLPEDCNSPTRELRDQPAKSEYPSNSGQAASDVVLSSDQHDCVSHLHETVGAKKREDCLEDRGDLRANPSKDDTLSVTGGTISVSTSYSQGLLNTLTHALKSSGLDLSKAHISVQIDIGKRTGALANCSAEKAMMAQSPESSLQNQLLKGHAGPSGLHCEQETPRKKLKIDHRPDD